MFRKPTSHEIALWAALPMTHTSRLEGRLTMILDTKTRRAALPRRAGAAAMLAAALLLPLAAARPVPRATTAPLEAVKLSIPLAALTVMARWLFPVLPSV